MSTLLGIVMSRVRVEEKLLIRACEKRKINFEKIDDNRIIWNLSDKDAPWDVVLDRSLSFGRSLATTRILESRGVTCINSAQVIATCGDKIATQVALERADIRGPDSQVAFGVESALLACKELGYPVVLKPAIGSWGRLVARLNDRDAAEAVLEDRSILGGWTHHQYYLQKLVNKPGRDIRLFVIGGESLCAIYRYSDHWITNTARGATAKNCPLDDDLREIGRRVASELGGVVLSVDLVENQEGERFVLEVNHNTEFRNSIETTGVNIPDRIIDAALKEARETEAC